MASPQARVSRSGGHLEEVQAGPSSQSSPTPLTARYRGCRSPRPCRQKMRRSNTKAEMAKVAAQRTMLTIGTRKAMIRKAAGLLRVAAIASAERMIPRFSRAVLRTSPLKPDTGLGVGRRRCFKADFHVEDDADPMTPPPKGIAH